MQYEFKILSIADNADRADVTAALNDLGVRRFDLVTTIRRDSFVDFVFKRLLFFKDDNSNV